MPSIVSKYGKGHALDLMITSNPAVFKEGMPDALPQGVQISEQGEITIRLNIHIDLRLAESGKSIRHMYIPFEVKFKGPEPLKYRASFIKAE